MPSSVARAKPRTLGPVPVELAREESRLWLERDRLTNAYGALDKWQASYGEREAAGARLDAVIRKHLAIGSLLFGSYDLSKRCPDCLGFTCFCSEEDSCQN